MCEYREWCKEKWTDHLQGNSWPLRDYKGQVRLGFGRHLCGHRPDAHTPHAAAILRNMDGYIAT